MAISQEAADLANLQIRKEFFEGGGLFGDALLQKISEFSQQSVDVLRQGWNPLSPWFGSETGFGFELKVLNPVITSILTDMNAMDRINEIATAAVAQTIVRQAKTFLPALLEDLMKDDSESFYQLRDMVDDE